MTYKLDEKPCVVCKKIVYAPYSRTRSDQWLCSRTCDEEYFVRNKPTPRPKGMIGDFLQGDD